MVFSLVFRNDRLFNVFLDRLEEAKGDILFFAQKDLNENPAKKKKKALEYSSTFYQGKSTSALDLQVNRISGFFL